jgi:nicotinate-nucleotide adenylyltransferase
VQQRSGLFPPRGRGQRIGLLGGSFNPAHAGHRAASLLALKRLRLDAVWWLVTPGNPLKQQADLASLDARAAQARKVAADPRIMVTTLEQALGTRFTLDTLIRLQALYPRTRFVWLMGADNLKGFHRWKGWRRIAARVPLAVIDRPGASLTATQGRAAQALARFRLPDHAATRLATRQPPALMLLHGLKSGLSSTALRAQRKTSQTAPTL